MQPNKRKSIFTFLAFFNTFKNVVKKKKERTFKNYSLETEHDLIQLNCHGPARPEVEFPESVITEPNSFQGPICL